MKIVYPLLLSVFIFIECAFPQSPYYVPGNSYWGKNHFVEYVAGNLPVIISVPHGGSLKPEIISDRTFGVNARDYGTQEVAREMIAEFKRRTGKIPHVVFSHLSRKKLDVNREEFEAAQEDPLALTAWSEYHAFIDSAKAAERSMFKKGILIDLHGQNNPEGRIEIGYRLENEELMMQDADLNGKMFVEKSSLKNLVKSSSYSHAELIRGKASLGALFDKYALPSTPSPSQPIPGSYKFYGGGYTIFRHAVEDTTEIFGVQFELNPELRSQEHTESTANLFVSVIIDYLNIHYGEKFTERLN
jgi:hypothetical protein